MLKDKCCTIVPYFKVHAGKIDEFKDLCERFVAKTKSEPKCLYYGFSMDKDEMHCREGYVDAESLLSHLENVGPLLDEAIKIADITRLEIHGPESELAKLREPLKDLNPQYFTLECGFRNENADGTTSKLKGSPFKNKKIGFVGVGRMGANMARRLNDCGYTISTVYDIIDGAAEALAEELECAHSTSLEGVTASSDIIITVVTNDAAVKRIFSAKKDHLLKSKTKGKVFINCATITPKTHTQIEAWCEKAHASSLEACMASSIPQAREGTLYLMVAGNKATFNKMKPLFEDMSKDLTYIGKAGKAAEVKTLVNMVMNINTAGLAEGLALGEALGVNLKMLCKVFSETGANSRVLTTDAEDMLNHDHECYFSAAHAAKDSGIAAKLGNANRVQLPLNDATVSQYRAMIDKGMGQLDKSGISELTFKGRGKAKR